ncbi:hypothetical protein FN924_00115 [Radiobacillus deserti]|uniref:Spore coat protein D n=1 Tax=Radiobacillus deserti TaxID=2594883 RepID=A0A516KBN9_9BACI|nr:hypothetical protein FN924_00115 [Radiobacillus deserti]
MSRPMKPIVCPPKYVVHNRYTPRVVPYIHPVVHVNRNHIVNIPRHIVRPVVRNEVVDPGYPTQCRNC